jgi:hypothetical protein
MTGHLFRKDFSLARAALDICFPLHPTLSVVTKSPWPADLPLSTVALSKTYLIHPAGKLEFR